MRLLHFIYPFRYGGCTGVTTTLLSICTYCLTYALSGCDWQPRSRQAPTTTIALDDAVLLCCQKVVLGGILAFFARFSIPSAHQDGVGEPSEFRPPLSRLDRCCGIKYQIVHLKVPVRPLLRTHVASVR